MHDLCYCIRKSRSGSITIQHAHEFPEDTPTVVQGETDLNAGELTAANNSTSNVNQGGDSEERQAPRRPRFQRPQNQRQAGSSDDPPVVFMYVVGEDAHDPASNLSEPVPDDDTEFTPPSDPTVTSTAPPSYKNSSQYSTCDVRDEKKQDDDPPPYYREN